VTARAPGWRPLALLLATAGATHLAAPRVYEPLIPRRLGDPRPWVLWSGVAELACAAGLALPRTRRTAALAAAGLLVAVYPGNVTMALDAHRRPGASRALRWGTLARLPVQVPLVAWAVRVAGDAQPAAGAAGAGGSAGAGGAPGEPISVRTA
jgi:uncharacterized membrane protein